MPPVVHETAFVHETAIVDDGAELGDGVRVWHFSHVCSGARIGAGSSLGQNSFVAGSVQLGKDCRVQNNVSLYDGVVLEDEVFCGPSVVFTNVVNPRAAVSRKHEYRITRVCRGASLGANATIVAGVTLGRWAFVAAGAVVTADVADFALVQGVPARQVGWMSRYGVRMDLPVSGTGHWTCATHGDSYELGATGLTSRD
jgi:UDP-2-acetamido-3-amino-2,3-dideoxy-glucuronate N-acetyltransferase